MQADVSPDLDAFLACGKGECTLVFGSEKRCG